MNALSRHNGEIQDLGFSIIENLYSSDTVEQKRWVQV